MSGFKDGDSGLRGTELPDTALQPGLGGKSKVVATTQKKKTCFFAHFPAFLKVERRVTRVDI